MPSIHFATLEDTQDIMQFMHDVWRENHILSKHKQLFLYEFQKEDKLNFAIARNEQKQLVGLFGYIFYNQDALPDIGGSLWKVAHSEKTPLLGLKMREYVMKHIPHRFFAAPGAGLQTKSIYHFLKMNWHTMQQFYCINPNLSQYHLIKITEHKQPSDDTCITINCHIQLEKITNSKFIEKFPFNKFTNIVPFKDAYYVKRRFFEHPIYNYDVYLVKINSQYENIIVCRTTHAEGHHAYRIVDFYGESYYLPHILSQLKNIMVKQQYEYIDFVCHGFDEILFKQAGFSKLDFTQEDVIIPNYYEPFLLKNVPVYCVSDSTNLVFRQCKADGDQDRPNLV